MWEALRVSKSLALVGSVHQAPHSVPIPAKQMQSVRSARAVLHVKRSPVLGALVYLHQHHNVPIHAQVTQTAHNAKDAQRAEVSVGLGYACKGIIKRGVRKGSEGRALSSSQLREDVDDATLYDDDARLDGA